MLTYNGKVVEYNSKWFDNFLPIRTARLWFYDTSFNPDVYPYNTRGTWTRVSSDPNIWDFTKDGNVWSNVFEYIDNTTAAAAGWEVLGANLTGVTDVSGMFYYCLHLKSVHNLFTPNITKCTEMFYGCEDLEHIDDFDTSHIKDGYHYDGFDMMFQYCKAMKEFPRIDTSGVSNFDQMYYGCCSMEVAPKMDTSSAKIMIGMFGACSALVDVPEYDTHNVTNFEAMFSGCSSLVEIPDFDLTAASGDEWHWYANLGGLSSFCKNCVSLEHVQDIDAPNCSRLYEAFNGCTSLKHIPNINCKSNAIAERVFMDCVNAESGILDSYNNFVSIGLSAQEDAYLNCGVNTPTGSAELAQIPDNWKGVT